MSSHTENQQDAVEHILVIRFSSLGDILLTAPTLRALRVRFPSAHIDLLVAKEYADAAKLIPGPNRIIAFDRTRGFGELLKLRRKLSRCYHVIVDLQNNFRSTFLRMFLFPTIWVKARRYRFRRWLLIHFKWDWYGENHPVPLRYLDAVEMLGCKHDGRGLDLELHQTDEENHVSWLTSVIDTTKPLVVICPGAKHFTKRWPLEHWIELCRLLQGADKSIVVLGDASESELTASIVKHIPQAIAITGESIGRVAALLKHAEFAVTNDSGIMHLAAGINTSVIAIFGSTVRQFGFAPFTDNAFVIEHDMPCRPCTPFGRSNCPKKHFRCMNDTTADLVMSKINELNSLQQQMKS